MGAFVRRVFLFFLPILFVLVSQILVIQMRVNRTVSDFKLSPATNKIALGDSHIQQSMNDSIISNMRNISSNSESLFYSFFKILAVTKNNPQIDTILLGASYHSFSRYYDEYTLRHQILNRYFYILPIEQKLEMIAEIDNPLAFFIYSLIDYLDYQGSSKWIAGFGNSHTQIQVSQYYVSKRVALQYHHADRQCLFSDMNLFYFQETVNFCRENGITLIIINTPLHSMYKQMTPQEYVDKFNSIIAENKLSIIDFDGFAFEDDDFLPDGDHVSRKGSDKASAIVDSLLGTPLQAPAARGHAPAPNQGECD